VLLKGPISSLVSHISVNVLTSDLLFRVLACYNAASIITDWKTALVTRNGFGSASSPGLYALIE